MTVGKRFNKFLSNIQLSSLQIEDAKTKYNGVCKTLHDYYYDTKYNGNTKLLVGSYGKRTAIAPPTDIDVLFIMPSSEYDRYDSYYGNGQSQLLQDIKNVLKRRYPSTDMRGDGQVVMVKFSSYNIELVPTFVKHSLYYIPDTNNGGSWRWISPQSELSNIRTSNNRSNGNTVKLIKMMKAWKHYCNVPIKSIAIELIAVNFLENWPYYKHSSIFYDWMVRDYLTYLLKNVNGSCSMPNNTEVIEYGDKWESKAKTALNNATAACELESEKEYDKATYEWKKIFGSRFYY